MFVIRVCDSFSAVYFSFGFEIRNTTSFFNDLNLIVSKKIVPNV